MAAPSVILLGSLLDCYSGQDAQLCRPAGLGQVHGVSRSGSPAAVACPSSKFDIIMLSLWYRTGKRGPPNDRRSSRAYPGCPTTSAIRAREPAATSIRVTYQDQFNADLLAFLRS
jgi:hypothetical protein